MTHYLFNLAKGHVARGQRPGNGQLGYCGSRRGASTQTSRTATRSPPATSSSSIWEHRTGSSSVAPSLPQRSVIGHRPRLSSPPAIRRAQCCSPGRGMGCQPTSGKRCCGLLTPSARSRSARVDRGRLSEWPTRSTIRFPPPSTPAAPVLSGSLFGQARNGDPHLTSSWP